MRLPLSGLEVGFVPLVGTAEAMIAELRLDRPVAGGIALLEILAHGEELAPARLALTDFELALVGLRCHLKGDLAVSEPTCPACGERAELSFSLAALARDVPPPALTGASSTLDGEVSVDGTRFRLPTAGDVRNAEGHANASDRILSACTGSLPPRGLRRRIEQAMARAAPLLSRVIEAPCAACGACLRQVIHVPSFVVTELTWAARVVFDDVHMLARGYGWREADILALPRSRRRTYAARLRESV